jgi:hypothetical protein
MNKRIAELAEQAGWDNHHSKFDTRIKKFAELIVWECMLICEDVMKKDNSALGCWIEIKRKFRS